MNFSQSLNYLNSFYDLEKTMLLPAARRWKLDRMHRLLELFDHPERNFLSVVIVGTKGKGSTGFFLQSILNVARIPTGFYSSPHLQSPRERIRIHGKIIARPLWCRLLKQIQHTLEREPKKRVFGEYTYFEIMTLMAALAFKEEGMKAAIFEAGMGGRLDAVNALGAPIVIVTPIHLDHQEFLGHTIDLIAHEKAAVIHAGADVIMAPQMKAAYRVIRTRAGQQGARLWEVTKKTRYSVGLKGDHQVWNASGAVLASEIICDTLNVRTIENSQKQQVSSGKKGSQSLVAISARAVKAGLALKDWPGRFEVLQTRPRMILDGAHNPAAVKVLVRTLRQNYSVGALKRCGMGGGVLIFGVTRDKDSRAMLKMLAQVFSAVVLVSLKSPRGKATGELFQEARDFFKIQVPAVDLGEALRLGKCLAGTTGTLVVTGSFYLVGAVCAILMSEKGKNE